MQPRKILLLDDAIRDLRGIYIDILDVSKSTTVAERYLKKLRHELRHLEYTAEACARYARADGDISEYRFAPICHYLAFFRISDDAVMVDRILHRRIDYDRYLR